jgi:hypothetical protein
LRRWRAYDWAALTLSSEAKAVGVTAKDKEREERLAAALRENLRRRKAQARAINEDKIKPDDQP